jgi:hypothetical protein
VDEADGVDGDVDPARGGDHGVGVGRHGVLVEDVERGDVGGPAGGGDVVGDAFEAAERAPGQVDDRALGGERPGDGAADGPTAAVDDGDLVGELLHGVPPGSRDGFREWRDAPARGLIGPTRETRRARPSPPLEDHAASRERRRNRVARAAGAQVRSAA